MASASTICKNKIVQDKPDQGLHTQLFLRSQLLLSTNAYLHEHKVAPLDGKAHVIARPPKQLRAREHGVEFKVNLCA